ncbi:MAG: type II secretion system F family protein [Clostridiales bacterium]|nr:type II secretion system F family protein [Clostridiales bacterium]
MSRKLRLSHEELSVLCEQIALVLRAGLPIHDGVEALCENYKGTRFEKNFNDLSITVIETGSLSMGFKNAEVFPDYLISMTEIGEKTGELDGIMEELSLYYDREAANRRSIKSALFYPLLLIIMMALLIGVLVTQVLPIFENVYGSFDSGSSAGWMNMAVTFGKVTLIVAGVLILVVILFLLAIKLDSSQRLLQFLQNLLPPLKRLEQKLSAARFASTLGMMLRSGFPLDESMDLVEKLFTNKRLRQRVSQCREKMEEGASFPDAVGETGIFDPLHCRMISVGFRAGQTDRVMSKLAALYDEEANTQIGHLVSVIEPSLVALMSIIIGAILLSVMLPLLSIMSNIG